MERDYCTSRPCQRGNCSSILKSHRCDCPSGYGGRSCQTGISLVFWLFTLFTQIIIYPVYPPPPPPEFCTTIVFYFSMIARRIKNNGYALFGGGGVKKVHYGLCDYRSREGNTRKGEEAFSPSFPSCARASLKFLPSPQKRTRARYAGQYLLRCKINLNAEQRKCMEISLEKLYVDLWPQKVRREGFVFKSFLVLPS